jgi:hypothetical protein
MRFDPLLMVSINKLGKRISCNQRFLDKHLDLEVRFGLEVHNDILNVYKVRLYSPSFLIDRVGVLLLNECLY